MSLPTDTRNDAQDTQRITRGGRRKRNEYALVAWYFLTLYPNIQDADTLATVCYASLEKLNVTANGPANAVPSVAWSVPTHVAATYPA